MGTLLDLVLILVVFLAVFINFKRGMLKMLKPFRFIASIMIALKFRMHEAVQNVIGKFINMEGFKAHINERVSALWGEKITDAAASDVANEYDRFSGIFGPFESLFGDVKNFCQVTFAEGAENFTEKVIGYASDAVLGFFTGVLGFLLVFCVSMLVLYLCTLILQLIFSRGLLKAVNSTVGGIIGLFFGLIIAWVLALVIVNFGPMFTSGDPGAVSNGSLGIVRWFYNDFILSTLFGITPI